MSKKKNYLFDLDRRQMLLALTGLTVICLLVFAAGYMVGSKTAMEEMRLANARDDYRSKIRAPELLNEESPIKPAAQPPEVKYAAPVRPEPSIESVIESAATEEASPKPAGKPPERAMGTQKEEGKARQAPKVVEAKRTETAKTEPSRPSQTAPAREQQGGGYAVQVASFPAEGDASDKVKELKGRGYSSVYVVKANIPGKGTYHRVRIGPFNSLDKAKEFALAFEKKEKASVFISKD